MSVCDSMTKDSRICDGKSCQPRGGDGRRWKEMHFAYKPKELERSTSALRDLRDGKVDVDVDGKKQHLFPFFFFEPPESSESGKEFHSCSRLSK